MKVLTDNVPDIQDCSLKKCEHSTDCCTERFTKIATYIETINVY